MKVDALEINLPFLCQLGWHKPKPLARWNCGYYFTICDRCGQDLVRTGYGRWHVPHGYRVVWQAQAPANAGSAALVRDGAAAGPAGGTELPIQEVLQHIQNGAPAAEEQTADPGVEGGDHDVGGPPDPPGAGPTADESAPAGEAALTEQNPLITTVPARRIPDFMDDWAGVGLGPAPSAAYLGRPAPAGQGQGEDFEEDRGPGPFRRLSARLMSLFWRLNMSLFARLKSLFGRLRSARAEPFHDRGAPAGVAPGWRLAVIVAIPIIAVLLALVVKDAWEDGRAAATNRSAAQGAQIRRGAGQPAFVTASLLNCRSAPARQAQSLKVLLRGDIVRLLARDGEWVSLVYEGGQCWALVRYFSLDRPI